MNSVTVQSGGPCEILIQNNITNTDITKCAITQPATKDTTPKIKKKVYYDEYTRRDRLDLVDIMD